MKVVPIREKLVSLNDIPGMLRQLADNIEAGQYGGVTTCYAIVPQGNGWPILCGFGDIEGQRDPIIQMERMKHWLIQNDCART